MDAKTTSILILWSIQMPKQNCPDYTNHHHHDCCNHHNKDIINDCNDDHGEPWSELTRERQRVYTTGGDQNKDQHEDLEPHETNLQY